MLSPLYVAAETVEGQDLVVMLAKRAGWYVEREQGTVESGSRDVVLRLASVRTVLIVTWKR